MDGSQGLRLLRAQGATLSMIISTARDALHDRIAVLELGANFYRSKPFDFGELKARMSAILRENVWAIEWRLVSSFCVLSCTQRSRDGTFGSGLGLLIAKRAAHEAPVSVEIGENGIGSVFTLPLSVARSDRACFFP